MKRLFIFLSVIFFCVGAHAQTETLEWYVDGNLYTTTTCESGGDITLPTAPTKTGYNFDGWLEYIPIEYLESTGTQYINTKINGSSNLKTEIMYMYTNLNTNFILGGRSASAPGAGFGIGVINGKIIFDYNNRATTDISATPYVIYKLIKDKQNNLFMIEDNVVNVPNNTENSFYQDNSIYLFALNNVGNTTSNAVARIFYVKIWDDNVLVRDFIPVLAGGGVPCMFDKVTHQFFYNQGTGNFIAGPVISGE